jgi:hypothetical protein
MLGRCQVDSISLVSFLIVYFSMMAIEVFDFITSENFLIR